MAGKHVGAWQNTNDPLPGFQWNERTTKAYAEGRYNIAPNGHVAGSDAYRAYVAGNALAADDTQAFESGAGIGGGGFSARAQAVIDNLNTGSGNLTSGEETIIANFVDSLSQNVYDSIGDMLAFGITDESVSLRGMKGVVLQGTTNAATKVAGGWDMDTGAGYIQTGVISSALPGVGLDDVHASVFVADDTVVVANSNPYGLTDADGDRGRMWWNQATSELRYAVQSRGFTETSTGGSYTGYPDGLSYVQRSGPTTTSLWLDGTKLVDGTAASTNQLTGQFWNINGSWSDNTPTAGGCEGVIKFASAGASLSDAEVLAFSNAVNTLVTALDA